MIKIALRQAKSNPFQSLLLVLGISLGTATCLLLASYISGQLNYDKFHLHGDNIVRIQTNHLLNGTVASTNALTYAGVPVLAKERLSQVKDFVRMGHWIANDVAIRRDGQLFRGRDCLFVDPSFFDVFDFDLIQGDPVTALVEPNSLVLTQSVAKLLFGEEDPMGKEVNFEHKILNVTGVAADPQEGSHIQFAMLGSLSTMHSWQLSVYGDEEFESTYVYGYLLLQDDVDIAVLERDLNAEVRRIRDEEDLAASFSLQPFSTIYLSSQLDNEMGSTGDGKSLSILACVAAMILLLAWLNHVNIFTAIAIDHAGARSVQRVVGASRGHLFWQLFAAAGLYAFLGLVFGIALWSILKPVMVHAFGTPLAGFSELFSEPLIIGFLFLGGLAICLFPASYWSKVSAKDFLVGHSVKFGGRQVRRILVTLQLAIIIVLLIGSGIIHRQLGYMQKHDLGLDVENVLTMRAPLGTTFEDLQKSMGAFKQQIESLSGVEEFSISHNIPGDQLELINNVELDGQPVPVNLYRNYGSKDFFDVYRIPFVIESEALSDVSNSNFPKVVINETFSEQLGFSNPEQAIGHELSLWGNDPDKIVGVVKNYNQRSLHHEVLPIVYDLSSNGLMSDGYFSLRLRHDADQSNTISAASDIYKKIFPHSVFDMFAAQEYFNEQYVADRRFKFLNFTLTSIGVVVACLGILGLIMISIRRRMKEIGIRKTLGATTESIFVFLSADFFRLVMVALIIAVPTIYYLGQQWLQNFAVRAEGLGWAFVWGGIIVFAITLAVVSLQCFRAARTNPVEILRET